MTTSVLDLFTVGIGPSSSHTVGPMRAAHRFATRLADDDRVARVRCELLGSLGATGRGHGSVEAVVLGLAGQEPHLVDPATTGPMADAIRAEGRLPLAGTHPIAFSVDDDVVLEPTRRLAHHSNGLVFTAHDEGGATIETRTYYSVGGGAVRDEDEARDGHQEQDPGQDPDPFTTAAELVAAARRRGMRISEVVAAHELDRRSEPELRASLLHRWSVMRDSVRRGIAADGVLPGVLGVRRRARSLYERLVAEQGSGDGPDTRDALHAMEWVTLYALAVNEENAAGGRIVTAPTNGAAGIVPAVLHYAAAFLPGFSDDDVVRFLLAAGAVGLLVKRNASISGAEVGCQGEVGSAASMAAAGLAEVLGGTPEQVENAAEIGIEHHLGLTCDPVGGLVQIPCIERNAIAAVTAINAARMAVRGDGRHHVSLDAAIRTMRDTGADMRTEYKETARGGLALTVVEC